MNPAYVHGVVLLHAAFAVVFFFLNRQRPNRFSRFMAWSWAVEAIRAAILLPGIHRFGGVLEVWFAVADVLCFFASWWLFAGFADLVRVHLPRWLAPVYFGASVPLVLFNRFLLPGVLASTVGLTIERGLFLGVFANLVIMFVPVAIARVIVLGWLFRLWKETRLPGALIAAIFAIPYAIFALAAPLQFYFSYQPEWIALLWMVRVLGLSVGLVILVLSQAESRIRSLNRTYALLSEINQTIVRVRDPQEILAAACRVAIEKGNFAMAWIGRVDPASRQIEVVSHAKATPEVVRILEQIMRATPQGGGCQFTSRVLATARHAICNDVEHDPEAQPWRDDALRFDYRAMVALPLVVSGKVFGTFNLYSAEPGFFDDDEMRVLDELASDISFALEAGEQERARQRAEEALRLSEERFRQAQKLEAIGRLAGGVAHDFNNLLTVILMRVAAINRGLENRATLTEGLNEINDAALRAASLTRQLLMFSRRQTMQMVSLEMNEVVAAIVRMLRRMVDEAVAVELRPSSKPLPVRADAGMLDQVVMNLVVNARDAMPHGGTIVITTGELNLDESVAAARENARPGSFVQLSVSDTGTGIDPEVIPRIFEPFFTTKEVGKGTGLGLATVYGIVQQHHGWVEVHSVVGKGTTFSVFLPREESVVPAAAAPPQSVAAVRTEAGETILLVEDDAAVRRTSALVLMRFGYRVLEAANGATALDIWRSHQAQVKLLLIDVVLPGGMSGLALADRLRRERPDVTVVFTSGYKEDVATRGVSLVAGEDFLPKPYSIEQLTSLIRRKLDGRQQRAEV